MPANLMEYFNKESGLGILSTSSSNGQVDSAIFGSPHMTDEKTVVVATAKNHSFANLLENPNAVYIRMEQFLDSPKTGKMKPGSSVMNWK
ncbi:MAG: pyridoxamine 5'-phosphate oxidase family protein [Methanosarcina sp.]